MILKLAPLFFLLLPVACNSDEIERVEKFRIDSFFASPECTIWVGDSPEKENVIMENLLGLNDSIYAEIFLHLDEKGKFNIIKGDQIALSGDWRTNGTDFTLITKNDAWRLEIERKNSDSLVLNFNGYYQGLRDLHITLKYY